MSDSTLDQKPAVVFFRKIFYRYLIATQELPGKSMGFLDDMNSYGKAIFGHEFNEYIDKAEENYKKSPNKVRDWIFVVDYIKAKEISDLKAIIEEHTPDVLDDFHISDNVHFLSNLLDLTDVERTLLQFYTYVSEDDTLPSCYRYVFSSISNMISSLADQYSTLFSINPAEAKKILSNQTNLLSSGILLPNDSYYFKNHYVLNDKILELITADDLNDAVVERVLFPSNLDTDLTYNDFHQKEEIDIMSNIISSGLKKKSKGINILLWGVPGTGKTELSLILSKKHKWELKVIGDISESEDSEKSRGERLFSLKIAQKLFRNQKGRKIVLLFDEMEDLFKIDMNANFSKAFVNRIIEKTRVPIIWTTNDLRNIGSSAVLRRMTYAINFKVPPVDARRKIWKKYSKIYKLDISKETIEDLAVDFDVVPALIANAAKVVDLSGVPNEDICKILSNLDTAMHLGHERQLGKRKKNHYKFEIELSNTNMCLNTLVNKILESKNQNFSMCLYGPPGTGKSAFARHLADKMKMKVSFKRASDLLSMWVGENEKNIAEMFKEAEDDKQFLILDEADSFLQSRQTAKNSWEVTGVNEMLTNMEFHSMPFVATTNLLETLDEASLRRFTFKIKFDFLRQDQYYGLFKFYFKDTPPLDLFRLDTLTPGDFANVKKKADFLSTTDSFEICKMLVEECEFKPQYKNPMGFAGPPKMAMKLKTEAPVKDDDEIAARKKD